MAAAAAVVLDPHDQPAAGCGRLDPGRPRAGALREREAVGDDAVGGPLELGREPAGWQRPDGDRESAALRGGRDRGRQPVAVEAGRVQAMGEFTQLLERAFERGVGGGDLPTLRSGDGARGDSERETQRDEPLLRAVVEVALEPAALLLGSVDDLPPRHAQRIDAGERRRL